jgi:hypothetical protein
MALLDIVVSGDVDQVGWVATDVAELKDIVVEAAVAVIEEVPLASGGGVLVYEVGFGY